MSTRLDAMIAGARELDASWDLTRSERVRDGELRRYDTRVRRDRALRRGLLIASGASLLVLGLLRAASSAPADPTSTATAPRAADGPRARDGRGGDRGAHVRGCGLCERLSDGRDAGRLVVVVTPRAAARAHAVMSS